MAIYQAGEKVLGYWGAMHPYGFGKIDSIKDGWCNIAWNDGTMSIERVGEIFHDAIESCGLGVYFCAAHELNQYPDHFFEIEAEEIA